LLVYTCKNCLHKSKPVGTVNKGVGFSAILISFTLYSCCTSCSLPSYHELRVLGYSTHFPPPADLTKETADGTRLLYRSKGQSFGKWVGTFVVFRNLFELLVSLVLASYSASWKLMYVYHFWIWRYRLLDVGPRRLMRSAKWQSSRNMLIVLVVLYIAVPILLWYNMVLFAGTEPCTNNSYTSAKENALPAGGRILYCTVAYILGSSCSKGSICRKLQIVRRESSRLILLPPLTKTIEATTIEV
jgi:hypothetical protein